MLHCNTKVVPLGAWSWVLSGHTLQVTDSRGAGGDEGGQVPPQLLPSRSRMHPLSPMPWNEERFNELHFRCAFRFGHQGSLLTLTCPNPGPSPDCPGQTHLWG